MAGRPAAFFPPLEGTRTSPPAVRVERAASDVSLDQLVRPFTAAGGKIMVKSSVSRPKTGKQATGKRAASRLALEVETSE